MFRNLTKMVADREYCALAKQCQHNADLLPEGSIGQEFAELARRWQLLAEQSGSGSRSAT